jgi:hypothetical protein
MRSASLDTDRIADSFSTQSEDSEQEFARANYFNCCETLLKVVEALVPMVRIAPKQTTTIKANITAYSTAVGPSSLFKKLRILAAKFFMVFFSKNWNGRAKGAYEGE